MSEIKFIIGNWKMNGLISDSRERVENIISWIRDNDNSSFNMVLCPPATLIYKVSELVKDSNLKFGGQDCHDKVSGAFTGNISAQMLKDMGADYTIVGHSERRQYHNETSKLIAKKAKAAHDSGLISIICIGEQGSDREAGKEKDIISDQLNKSIPDSANVENTIIAYEPIWAIGTGKTASNEDIAAMHDFIRAKLENKFDKGSNVPILYGGSVKAANAKEILKISNVNGVLVGGASLKADEFCAIAEAS